ncbi:MAG TPA: tetratricopeptide repeat-containing sensor histidine kinase [Puia sp.]|nr:tetratricopeptide repeat-containing sensor histidine kinase [Puia sp.]
MFKTIPVLMLVLFSRNKCFGQQHVHLPDNLKQQFKLQCIFCRQHPYDSSTLIALNGNTNNSQVNFHNSIVALINGDLDDAYTFTLNTITHIDSVADKSVYHYAYFIKAKILYYKKLYAEATAEYLRLLTIPLPDEVIKSNIYTNLGEIYMQEKNFTVALNYFNTWQQLYGGNGDLYSYKTVSQNKGLCFFYLNRYKEAEDSYLKTIAIGQQLHDTLALAIAYANLANLYYTQLLDSKAIPSFQQSLVYAKKTGDIEILKDANLNMAVVEENRKRFKEALVYRKQYEQLQDSIWNRDNIWKLTSQERKFDAQLNENKIQLLEQQATLRSNELKTRNWQRNTLFAAAIALLIIAGLVYNAYRLKARKNLLISKQKEELDLLNKTKDRLYSIVAHDLRSPVYSLKSNLAGARNALSQNLISEADTALGNAQTTAVNTYALLDNMLHWALTQTNQLFFRPEKLQLAVIVKQVCYDYIPFASLKNISIQQNVPVDVYIQADLNSLKIILRNLLDNAIKYTQPGGSIQITATVEVNKCCLRVKDTGIGMNETILSAISDNTPGKLQQDANGLTSTGFGLDLCKLMAEKNNGTIQINSKKDIGTEADIYLPLIA